MPELTCAGCGKQLAAYTRFCPECGAQRPEPQSVAPPPLPAYASDPAAPPRRRTLWWILGGVGCLGVVLVGACISIGALTLLGRRVAASPTPTATAISGGVIEPDSSPLSGGDVLLDDDFSSPDTSDLDASEDETSRSAYEDDAYVLEVKEPGTVVWSLVGGPYKDVSVQIDAVAAPGSDVAYAGLVFHYQDNDNFYLYSVANDGYYTLEVLQDGVWTTLIDPTLSDAVRAGRNTLRVETRGDRIALYANGALLEKTADGLFTSGEVGLAVSTFEGSTGVVNFDNLLITQNDP
ncbi:MAG: zinc ribbon domain-containing protein [Chloroflexales bacterium]|nr:zinc ribbon domain-containing protein [Chloroflexales bacterium]